MPGIQHAVGVFRLLTGQTLDEALAGVSVGHAPIAVKLSE